MQRNNNAQIDVHEGTLGQAAIDIRIVNEPPSIKMKL